MSSEFDDANICKQLTTQIFQEFHFVSQSVYTQLTSPRYSTVNKA